MEENLSLEEQIEKLKEENEKLKLTHTKIEEKIKKYMNKKRK
jgi:cell division protein FtsB